jgi:hypothetical protein
MNQEELLRQGAYLVNLIEIAMLFGMTPETMSTWIHGFTSALRFVAEHPEQTGPLAAAYVRAEDADPNVGTPPLRFFADIAERFPKVTANILATLETP